MTFTAFIFIAASIVLHGSWHFLCKSSGKVSMAFFALFSSSLFVSMLPWALGSGVLFDLPGNVLWYAFWGAFSGAMCNFGLMLAYRSSDISQAYPMARALPVFLTMAGTSLFGWGKALSGPAIAGMIIIFSGCVCMALTNGKMSSRREKIAAIKKGFLGILIASLGTTGYTIIDSFGIKAIMAAFPEKNRILLASSYSCFRELVAATLMWLFFVIRFRQGKENGCLKTLAKTFNPYLAGLFAGLAYGLILIAMNYVENVSFVQAFRQLSLPFTALLGAVFLKEKISRLRWIALSVIILGLFLTIL